MAKASVFGSFANGPLLMGVVNVTPDSFSDGGKWLDPAAAAEHAEELIAHGAAMIDLGAESTQPGSRGVPAREQLRRLLPVLKRIKRRQTVPTCRDAPRISIDTQSAEVAEACLDAGAAIINDVSALRCDPKMLPLLSKRGCGVILMHMKGTPRTMQQRPKYRNVVSDVRRFLEQRVAACERAGIARERLAIDPGIGFGKTTEHNLTLLRELAKLTVTGIPVVVGVSRKRFLGELSGERDPAQRDAASVVAGLFAATHGARILRVHNVAAHAAALKVMAALKSV